MAEKWSSSVGLDLHLDWSGRPGSKALAEAMRSAVRDGRLAAGSRMPSTRALAQDLGVARGTVTRAYDQLVTEGFLLARQGAPTTVAEQLTSSRIPAAQERASPPIRWNFRPGRPDLSAFPRRDWLAATRRALQSAPAEDFDLGDPQGHPGLREALTDYLARVRAVSTGPERIVVCNGYLEALSLLSKALRDQGARTIDFEDPSLAHLRDIPREVGMSVRGIPVDEGGIDVSHVGSPAVVVTPAHQSPLGNTMRPERRTDLVRLAKSADVLVIEDDYDGEFRFDRQPVGAVQGMAPDHVAYAGTTSKTLAPALRIAWLALPARLVAPVRSLKVHSGGHTPVLEQLTLAELIRSGAYDQHVRRSRALYRRRRQYLVDALGELRAQHRPFLPGISAGLNLTLRLDQNGPSEDEILVRARRKSVELAVLGPHWVNPGDRPPGVMIGYAGLPGHSFRPGVRTLMDVLDQT